MNILPNSKRKSRNDFRFLAFLLFVCLSFVSYNAQAQNSNTITLNVQNEPVENVFNQLSKQTGLKFFYDQEIVDSAPRVTVNMSNVSLEEVLKHITSQTKLYFNRDNHTISVGKQKTGQVVTNDVKLKNLDGRVVDPNGEPIIGASVLVKGTTNGVITDLDGNYHLTNVPENALLAFSYIGYQTVELKANGKGLDKIIMKEDNELLDEVVVVGYGTAKKSDLAGAVVRADLSTLQESPNISLGSALQGLVPGLNVGAVTKAGENPSISIRGRNSISGGTSPLIVLDGIIYRGDLVDINMNDVETIDVLKDASAAAIYGSEASNGVILITSKVGKVMSKPIIEYSGSFSFQQPTNKDLYPTGREGFLRRIADRFLEESRTGDDLLQPNPNWDVTKHLMDGNVLNGYLNGTDINWWDMLTNYTPYIQVHNLSVRGKNELSSYFLSVGYTDQENLIINDTYKRYNVRANMDLKVTDWLKVGMQSFFTVSDYSGQSPTLKSVMELPPLAAVSDSDGEYVKQPYKSVLNPMLTIRQDDVDKRYNLSGNFYVDIDFPFLKGLNYRVNLSQNLIENKEFKFNKWGANFEGEGSKMNDSQYNWTVDNILSYKNTFGKHAVNATFVYGAEKRQYESTTAGASKFLNDVLGYNNLGLGQSDLQTASSEAWEETSLYLMLRAIYTFNDKYIFTGTIRRDGFSGFGKDNKFGVFPSAAIAWRVSEENFIKDNVKWIDNLKLRLSYGQNGNRTVGRYQTLAKIDNGNGYLFGDGATGEQKQWVSSMPNSNLKWETTNTFNVGIDFSLLNGRIFGNLEYYRAKTHDLLYNINIPQINGLGSIPTNIGKLSNKGFEMSVTGVPVQTKDLVWNITFNFSRNRNKVVSILGQDLNGDGREDDLVSEKIFINHPYGVVYDYNLIGMWQIEDYLAGRIPDGFTYGTYKVEDVNGDGDYTQADDRKILGYTDPAYRFSVQNSIRYKNWELKFMINSVQGGKKYYYGQPGKDLNNPDNVYQNNSFDFDYWTPENPNACYRQLGYSPNVLGTGFSPYMQRNFVRLQDVTLSYDVPANFLGKFHINRLKFYVTGKNLLTFTKWDGWDPESGSGLKADYPVMRSYSVGLNVEF